MNILMSRWIIKKKEERKIPKLSTNWFNFTSKMYSIERKEKWKRKEEQKEKKSRWLKVDQTWHYQRRLLSSFLSFKRHHNFFLFFIFSTIDIDIFECKSTLLTKNFSGFTIPRFIGRFYWWRCWYHDAKTNLTVSLIGKVNRIIKCGWAIALTFEFTLTYSSGVTLRTAFPPVRSGPSNYVYACTRARARAALLSPIMDSLSISIVPSTKNILINVVRHVIDIFLIVTQIQKKKERKKEEETKDTIR